MPIDTAFRTALRTFLDPLTNDASDIKDVTLRRAMPWGKAGEIKLRMQRLPDGSVMIHMYRKGDNPDPWGA